MTEDKAHSNDKFRQLILLNNKVELLVSDDLIFSTEKLREIPVGRWFPFIESTFNTLMNLKESDGEVIFSKVESPSEFLPGTYDFSFIKVDIEGKKYIQWSIYDYTKVYEYLARYQQLKNEKDIYRQQLEYKSKKMKTINELLSEYVSGENYSSD